MTLDKGRFQRLVGKLIYLSRTLSDIAYAMSILSQFMHSPKVVYLKVIQSILQYLKSTPVKGILFRRDRQLSVEAYTDVDWARLVVDRRSTLGYWTI